VQLLNAVLVLLEAPFDPIRRQMNSVLLTVDLTKAVADEAIERKDCVVVAYRVVPLSPRIRIEAYATTC
jgi:putative NIF3 family GTP cyclohydrolase 1 type 2